MNPPTDVPSNFAAACLGRIFPALPPQARQELESELEPVIVPGGEVLIRQGDSGDCLYLLLSGRLRVVDLLPEGGERNLAEVAPGQAVGEMALLTGDERTATVYAIRDSRLARLSQASFDRVLQKYPLQITRGFARTVVERLRATPARAAREGHRHATIALVPATADVPLKRFAEHLVRALQQLAPTRHLDHQRMAEGIGSANVSRTTGGQEEARVLDWLAMQEAAHRYVVYEADFELTDWTRRCVRQADHVLVVGCGGVDSAPGPIETELLQDPGAARRARQSLVLLYTAGQQPNGTARWLAGRSVHRHYHVRLEGDADFARLARVLTGQSVALVLGGGGSRGLAHIGVIRAMRECGIPIDFVGGASAGALVGAQCAQEWAPPRMAEVMSQDWGLALMDFTLPAVALVAGHKLARKLTQVFGDTQIEDLWLPYFCVSANLTRAELQVHRDGPVRLGIRASGSVAGVLPPVVHRGDLLVDGAVLNNVPVDVMSDFCEGGHIIAVDVSPPVDLSSNTNYGMAVRGHRVIWSRLNPLAPPIRTPGMVAIMQRAQELGSIAHQKRLMRGIADLYLLPPVGEFFLFDFKSGPRIMEIGYRYAIEELSRWQAAADIPSDAIR